MSRAEAVHHAIHEMELEGFCFTSEELETWEKVASGEMSLDELLESFERFDHEMRLKHPELYEQERRIFKRQRHRSPKRR